jgi:hypothetical protein
MKQPDENFASMCRAVQNILTQHQTEWQAKTAFKNQVLIFNDLMDALSIATEGAEIVSTGATEDKANAENAAAELAVNLAKRASIYAMSIHNLELHDQLRISKSSLLKRPDTLTLAKLKDIHSRLTPIISELEDYGVMPADLAELKTLTDTFETLITRPRELIVDRKGYNQHTIPELLASLRETLYKTDSLINIFSGSTLETSYKDARIIIDLGIHHNHPPKP